MRVFLKFLAVAAGAAVTISCSPVDRSAGPGPSSPSSVQTPAVRPAASPSVVEAPPRVAARLDKAPVDCRGPEPRPRIVTRAYGKVAGGKPLWAGFYATYQPEGHAYAAPDAPRERYGFRIKVLWIMAPRQQEPVRV